MHPEAKSGIVFCWPRKGVCIYIYVYVYINIYYIILYYIIYIYDICDIIRWYFYVLLESQDLFVVSEPEENTASRGTCIVPEIFDSVDSVDSSFQTPFWDLRCPELCNAPKTFSRTDLNEPLNLYLGSDSAFTRHIELSRSHCALVFSAILRDSHTSSVKPSVAWKRWTLRSGGDASKSLNSSEISICSTAFYGVNMSKIGIIRSNDSVLWEWALVTLVQWHPVTTLKTTRCDCHTLRLPKKSRKISTQTWNSFSRLEMPHQNPSELWRRRLVHLVQCSDNIDHINR
jgi:hypothetical protein